MPPETNLHQSACRAIRIRLSAAHPAGTSGKSERRPTQHPYPSPPFRRSRTAFRGSNDRESRSDRSSKLSGSQGSSHTQSGCFLRKNGFGEKCQHLGRVWPCFYENWMLTKWCGGGDLGSLSRLCQRLVNTLSTRRNAPYTQPIGELEDWVLCLAVMVGACIGSPREQGSWCLGSPTIVANRQGRGAGI